MAEQITANEPQFTGHFPERPIMPGVLMVEAMAQLSGVLCLQAPVSDGKGLFFFAGACVRGFVGSWVRGGVCGKFCLGVGMRPCVLVWVRGGV